MKPTNIQVLGYYFYLGLNLSREIGTYFAQESLFKSSCVLAEKFGLPIILHINNAASLLRAIEILRNEGFISSYTEPSRIRILLHDPMTCCEASTEHFSTAIASGMYFLLAATGLTDTSEEHTELRRRAQDCASLVPSERILLCSDSPWKTPQNISDPYLRTLRNEPCNIASIAQAVAEARQADVKGLSQQIRANTISVLGLGAVATSTAADDGADDVTKELKTMKVHFIADLEHTEKADISPVQSPTQITAKNGLKPAGPPVAAKASVSKAYYSCLRCRARLFSGADIQAHTTNTTVKSVFKVGEEGLCASTLLFKFTDSDSGSSGADSCVANKAVSIRGNSVECAECSSKLGKVYFSEANCGCGAVVPGQSCIVFI